MLDTCTNCSEEKSGGIWTNGDGYGDAKYVDIVTGELRFFCWDCKDAVPNFTEEIDQAFIEYEMCGFLEAWIGRCRRDRPCDKHINQRCWKCGEQAVRNCNHAVSLVCGMPECAQHSHMTYAHIGG